ncbi:hypothetical protein Xbed_02889 [Xenorhabdus beddingii]|uniref:Uncharacterized protein n=1 Tax=Xenorhabdus beddingii TaxID=40578 RepID=A0A1Y2SMN9_9GAMM|nr:hypothetical protein [Xenorhabdus beddingii]OTA18903.1 hypothetical protein Xbed_02889 [Xenorhabdus beddingii]
MLIKDILHDAVKKTQTAFMGGSTNRFYLETKDIDKTGKKEPEIACRLLDTAAKKSITLHKLRAFTTMGDHIDRLPYIYSYINESKFKLNLVGNCSEYCKYALHYLIKYHSFKIFNLCKNINSNPSNHIFFILYETPSPNDHCFINLYHMTDQVREKFNNDTFSHIQPDSWICDPWADIVCRGKEYPQQWKNRMKQWYYNNIYVATSDSKMFMETKTDRYNQFYSPLRPNVYNIISDIFRYIASAVIFIDNVGKIMTINDGKVVPYNMGEISRSELSKSGFIDINKINLGSKNIESE